MFDVVRPRRSRGFSFGCGSQGKNTIKAYISNRNGYDSNLISFVFKLMVSMVVNLPFSGPPFLSFCPRQAGSPLCSDLHKRTKLPASYSTGRKVKAVFIS